MTYRQRLSLFMIIDSLLVLSAIFLSAYLLSIDRYAFVLPIMTASVIILICHHSFSIKYKLYKKVWEYASVQELLIILKVVSFSILTASFFQILIFQAYPFKFFAITWLLHLFLIGGSRFVWRVYRDSLMDKKENQTRTLIVGAGAAGTMIARQILKNKGSDLLPVAFIDDDKKKQALDIFGISIVGTVKDIEDRVNELDIEHIIISIPSLSMKELNIIFRECAKTEAKTKILPLLEDLFTGKVSMNQFRDVEVEDLLGRDPVNLDMETISNCVASKVVLVTGAGGSIGSEISRQILGFHPGELILLGNDENSIYEIELELLEIERGQTRIQTEIADVRDAEKMMVVMGKYNPDVVYHAAAHKHVPLMERNPEEAVKNNMIGTKNVALAANTHHVDTFVLVSTDKAVNPTSVMGASKRLAEMIVQDMNKYSHTRFTAVRFGNVLGSTGSVIPLFKKQIKKGGPVTVTHPEMVRYFMTIPEASRLVIQAGSLARGGEIFVLDMGDPVRIVDLAKNLIKLSGHSIEEIGIAYMGIRPGEKLFEEMLNENEIHENHVYPNIYVGKATALYINEINEIIACYYRYDTQMLKARLVNLANDQLAMSELKSVVTI